MGPCRTASPRPSIAHDCLPACLQDLETKEQQTAREESYRLAMKSYREKVWADGSGIQMDTNTAGPIWILMTTCSTSLPYIALISKL